MKYIFFFAIYVLYSLARQAMKKRKQEEKLRIARSKASATSDFGTFANASQREDAELNSVVAKLVQRRIEQPFAPSYDALDYTEEIPEYSAGEGFVLNQGFSKRERSDLNTAFDVETARLSAVKTKVEFTPKALREFFVMREVLGAPRAKDPFRPRKTYYDPNDQSRD